MVQLWLKKTITALKDQDETSAYSLSYMTHGQYKHENIYVKLVLWPKQSAYRIMTGVKRLDKVRNSVVLHSVSRNDLIHTWYFSLPPITFPWTPTTLGSRTPEPTHGKTRRGRPRTNYITYIQKITGHSLFELIELAQNRKLTSTCGRVCWSTATRLEEKEEEPKQNIR